MPRRRRGPADLAPMAPAVWRPTPEANNALPPGLREYVHDLETRADPAGDVQTIADLREQVVALTRLLEEDRARAKQLARERDEAKRIAARPASQRRPDR